MKGGNPNFAHRKYGRVRLRLQVLLHGWSLIALVELAWKLLDDPNPDAHIQPVLVLRSDPVRLPGGGARSALGPKRGV